MIFFKVFVKNHVKGVDIILFSYIIDNMINTDTHKTKENKMRDLDLIKCTTIVDQMPIFENSEKHHCYDCGSTIPRHHTPLCEMAWPGDELDLPAISDTQWWDKNKGYKMSLLNEKKEAIEAIKELVQMVSTEHEDLICQALDLVVAGNYEKAFETANVGIEDLEG